MKNTAKKTIILLLGMSGIVLNNMTPVRWLSIILSVVFLFFLYQHRSQANAFFYWGASMIFHYTILFGTFIKGGFKDRWLSRGISFKQAYLKFEGWLSLAFFHNGLAFGFLYINTPSASFFSFADSNLVLTVGLILQLTGFTIKFLAAWLVGIPTYYYKDMFCEEKVIEFKKAGVYKYVNNPMYGIGQLNGYGAAITAFSLYGIMSAGLNQLCIYLFFYLFERPFIDSFYAKDNATLETVIQ